MKIFKWLNELFFSLDDTATVSKFDLYEELKIRSPCLYKLLASMNRYDVACFLCSELGLPRPKGSDLIFETEEKIIKEMRIQDWRE